MNNQDGNGQYVSSVKFLKARREVRHIVKPQSSYFYDKLISHARIVEDH